MKHVRCIDCAREMPRSEVVNDGTKERPWWLCVDRGACLKHITDTSSPSLEVAFCPGCARMWTRHEMAVQLWSNRNKIRSRALQCCDWDYDGGFGRRPRTLRELVQGRFGRFTEQEDTLLRAVVLYLIGRSEQC